MHASNFGSRPVSSAVGSLMDTSFVRQAACDAHGEHGRHASGHGAERLVWQRVRSSIALCIAFASRRSGRS